MDAPSILQRSAALLAAARAARTTCLRLCEQSAAIRRETAFTSELALAQVAAPQLRRLRRQARVYLRWMAAGRLAAAEACEMMASDILDAGLEIEPTAFLEMQVADAV